MLYADDEQVNGHFTSAEINAQAVFDWVTENGLELNFRKTKAIFGSTRNLAMLPNGLPQIKINGSAIPNVEQAKNFGLLMTPSLNWHPQISSITNKVYTTLSSLKFHRKSLNLPLRKQLIQTLALSHFDYASITFMNSDKTQALANITSHLTHRRLHLGWLSITGRQHLKLASLAYSVLTKQHPPYLSARLKYTPIPPSDRRPTRTPPQEFEYAVPRKSAWEKSFTISAKRLLNSLATTEFDVQRLKEFKTWCFQLFLLLEIEAWQAESYLEGCRPLTAISSLPPAPFNESAFTFTNMHLYTPGHKITLPFIKVFP